MKRNYRKSAVWFFFSHAGYSYDPKTETRLAGKWRNARALAKAEREIKQHDVTITWDWDQDGCTGCDCGSEDCACSTGAPHETLVCLVRLNDGSARGQVLASLGAICSPDRDYTRVIEAELASEALAELQRLGAEVNA